MNYYVYTDGARSVERGVGSWAYLIYTDTHFIEWNFNKTVYISSPTFAEDIAVGVACHSLLKQGLTKEDKVFFYSDSLATIKLLSSILDNNIEYTNKDVLIEDAVNMLRTLHEQTNIEFCKAHAHRNVLNPNICVDRMAKYVLRS
jgi:ribonuclease HI